MLPTRALTTRPSDDLTETFTGEPVEIRCTYDGSWTPGFEIADILPSGDSHNLQIRRSSDGEILPLLFSPDVVRSRGLSD